HRAAAGAREHRPPALDEHLGALAGALQLEPSGRLGEREQLQHLGQEEVAEISAEDVAHRARQRTSSTTRPRALAASPVRRRRLYQPITSTWITVEPSSTPIALSVSGIRRSASGPPATWS